MSMKNIEVTKREVVSSIIIVLAMISIGYFISIAIHNSVSVSNEKYFKSVKIDNDADLFDHVINTEVGDIMTYGKLKAIKPVSDSMIDGEYLSIQKIEEHYIKKTRTVTYTDSNGKTKTRTETYWEWDEVSKDVSTVKTFEYLSRTFDISKVKLYNYSHRETVKKNGFSKVRWQFYVIPKEFDVTWFSVANGKDINKIEMYIGRNINSVINDKEREADNSSIIFWIIWSMLIIGVVVGFVALDNKYLNGK